MIAFLRGQKNLAGAILHLCAACPDRVSTPRWCFASRNAKRAYNYCICNYCRLIISACQFILQIFIDNMPENHGRPSIFLRFNPHITVSAKHQLQTLIYIRNADFFISVDFILLQ